LQAADKDFWCKRPQHLQKDSNLTSIDLWRKVSNSSENCHIYDYDWSTVTTEQLNVKKSHQINLFNLIPFISLSPSLQQADFSISNHTAMIECSEWEFNMTDSLGNTWSSEWSLVCEKKYLKIVAEMIFLIGVATGGLLAGMLSDKFGRKKMLFISAVFQAFFGK
jgi:hypothetical protein